MKPRDYTGDMIFSLLCAQNKSQQDLADALGIKKSVVSEWSRGVTRSYKNYLNEIANFLEVSTDYLLGNNQKNKPHTTQSVELNSTFDLLNHDNKQKILELARLYLADQEKK